MRPLLILARGPPKTNNFGPAGHLRAKVQAQANRGDAVRVQACNSNAQKRAVGHLVAACSCFCGGAVLGFCKQCGHVQARLTAGSPPPQSGSRATRHLSRQLDLLIHAWLSAIQTLQFQQPPSLWCSRASHFLSERFLNYLCSETRMCVPALSVLSPPLHLNVLSNAAEGPCPSRKPTAADTILQNTAVVTKDAPIAKRLSSFPTMLDGLITSATRSFRDATPSLDDYAYDKHTIPHTWVVQVSL